MNGDVIIARLAGLEFLAASCFTFLLASAGNDPDLSKARAILDVVKSEADSGLAHLPEKIGTEAKAYLSSVIDKVFTNLTALRGDHRCDNDPGLIARKIKARRFTLAGFFGRPNRWLKKTPPVRNIRPAAL